LRTRGGNLSGQETKEGPRQEKEKGQEEEKVNG
jgi:hypothetical protein